MKPTLQLLLVFNLILFASSCQSASDKTIADLRENSFPSFEEIYTHVNKQITAPGKNCQFGLAKKADGYYLKIIPYKENEPQTPKFIKAWDAISKKHLSLEIDSYLDRDVYNRNDYKEGLQYIRTSGKNFDLNYFYGYPNYTTDLINLLKDQEDLNNSELEMLARAYSAEACDYIHPNQFGSEITATKDLSDPMYEKISQDRVSSFMNLSEKSLACYQKIKDKDPAYKTMVFDDLDLKVNHDYMNNYMLLKSVQENEAAEEMLKKTNYKADAIAYAKELLDDCIQNGVLITSGDTDTFPLWFVQDKLHYRTDVIVINHSLLQTPWYFDYIRHTTSIKSALTIKEYQYFYKSYVVLKKESGPELNYPEWLAQVRTDKDLKKSGSDQPVSWMTMPEASQNLLIDIQGTSCNFSARNGYLFGVELCMLDLINTNKNRIFHTTSPYVFSENNLKDHLAKRNLVYELTPTVNVSNWDKESNVRLQKSLQSQPIKINSSKLGDIEKGIIYSQCFDWILIPKEEIDANKGTFELFLKQLPFKTVLESTDNKIPELYAAALMHMNPKKGGQFLDSYSPKALKLIASINNHGLLSEKDSEMLRSIYMSYIGRKKSYISEPNPDKDSELQQKVVIAIKNKVITLCDNPVNIKNLSWTMDLLNKMKTGLVNY